MSQRGTRQGSALGGFFFCVALQPVLDKVVTQFPTVEVRAYVDDVTLVGKADDVARAFELYERECKKFGLEMNRAKCEWLSKTPADDRKVPQNLTAVKGCIKLLGAYIGAEDACASALGAAVKKRDAFFDHLRVAEKEVGYH